MILPLACLAGAGWADQSAVTHTQSQSRKPRFHFLLAQAAGAHATLSQRVEAAAKSLDRFFATDKTFDEETNTYLRLRFETVVDKDLGLSFKPDVKVRLDLPRTKRSLKLLLETDPDDSRRRTSQSTPVESLEKQDYFLSLERTARRAGRWDVRPAAGIRLDWPPDPFMRLRAIRYFPLRHPWLLRTAGQLFWFGSRGVGARTDADFDRALSATLLFRSTTTLSWTEDDNFARAAERLFLFQYLDPRQSIVYELDYQAKDDPRWAADRFGFQIRYRKRVYGKWLFMELTPRLSYSSENHFDPDPSFTLRLEAVFGREYL
ncbi:MAG TPA: hypothetical protein ENJ19_07515 [Gammaproteobacteria bacterium]|nr:hypothetical protein [Gammaproteobacteria bacterium]